MIEHGPNNGGQEWSKLPGPPASLSWYARMKSMLNSAARDETER